MTRPLEGIRVIELGTLLASPFCTLLLGDFGADVIKLESEAGDDTRNYPPTYPGTDISAFYVAINRGKRSICLDLKKPGGKEAALKLCATADAVVENLRLGVADRLGVGYEAVKARNPKIVYCSISGFGHMGPRAGEPAMELLMQAYSGQMSMMGHEGGPPARYGSSMTDLSTGLYSALGIVSAIHHRDRTGEGTYVRTSLLETQAALISYWWPTMQATGEVPGRMGSGHPMLTPYQSFAAKDGDVIIGVVSNHMFAGVTNAMGQPELADDPRFKTNADRLEHRDEIVTIIGEFCAARTRRQVADAMRAEGVPATPVNTLADILAEEQMQAMGGLASVDQPGVGPVDVARQALWFDGEQSGNMRPAASLGEHGREVLQEAGLGKDEIETLIADGTLLKT
ncbi:MAG: CoA transferase [Alphaproteobacteria bacterium]|jgi:crotonobetainyl-CoA:carnitine CoA-transferase CaiB-like acyl-CoA transferase|nr:CoA transferase [Alphaproteobacteria bacterium]